MAFIVTCEVWYYELCYCGLGTVDFGIMNFDNVNFDQVQEPYAGSDLPVPNIEFLD